MHEFDYGDDIQNMRKQPRTLTIHQIRIETGEQLQFYNFNEDDPNIFQSVTFTYKYHNNMLLYFYQNISQKGLPPELIVSNTMDHTGKLRYLFALLVKETPTQFIFRFLTIKDLVTINQAGKSVEAMKARLEKRKGKNEGCNNRKEVDLLGCERIPSYFYSQQIESPEIFLVPRYMHPLELQEGMKLHYHVINNKNEIFRKSCLVNELSLEYKIDEVYLDQISNNTNLSFENQCNLLHICEDVYTDQPNQLQCVICLLGQSTIKKNSKAPNYIIDVCTCSGKFIHIKCFASYIIQQSKQSIRCPTCKKPSPQFIELCEISRSDRDEKNYRYFSLMRGDNEPYIRIDNKKISLFSNSKIIIGSEESANFKVLSFESAKFASIHYNVNEEKAFLVDEKSNFGILVTMKDSQIKLKKNFKPYNCAVLVEGVLYYFGLDAGLADE